MNSTATLETGGSLRLFLALLLPHDATDAIVRWSERHLDRGRRPESLHITLAFLGERPATELEAIVGALRESAASARFFTLALARYRESRSVGMLVLDDRTGEAARLAGALQGRLEELGSYRRERRPWLPHVTVLRFRERPRLRPPVAQLQAELGSFAPSEAAAFLSRLHPRSAARDGGAAGARYEVLETCRLSSSELNLS